MPRFILIAITILSLGILSESANAGSFFINLFVNEPLVPVVPAPVYVPVDDYYVVERRRIYRPVYPRHYYQEVYPYDCYYDDY